MGLQREDLITGRLEERLKDAERRGLVTLLSPAERAASRRAIMDAFGTDEIWLFGYGSLMWNPCIHYYDRQPGLVHGYHRSFCVQTVMGRGSPERPGLTLALKPGGSCRGILYHIERALADAELDLVWNREMVSGVYVPRIVRALTPIGPKRAAAFVANIHHPRYACHLSLQETADIIAVAQGWLGTCADYLDNTVAHLDELGVGDGPMHELLRRVRLRTVHEA